MKSSLSFYYLLCALTTAHVVSSQNAAQDRLVAGLGEEFAKGMQNAVLSVGVYDNGKISYYNYGSAGPGSKDKPDPETVYEIGSVTKTFVSFVLANSIIEKRISLDDDIRKYLDGSYKNLEFGGRPIRIAHLANTTSGIPNWLPVTLAEIANAAPDSTAFLRNRVYGKYTKGDFFEALHNVALDTIPGFKTRHSNGAAQLLMYILEKVYNAPIEKLVSDYITSPNKMTSTSFLASKNTNRKLVFGYDGKGNRMPYLTTDVLKGAGGLSSTTSDLVNFIKLQLNYKNKAVSLSQDESFDAGEYSIGLNWLKYKYDNGNHQIWTNGGTYGFTSYVVLYPEINSGIVVLANVSGDEVPGQIGNIAYKIFEMLQKKQ